jgi:membrane dipeptidase
MKPLLIDAHQDLAWNMHTFGRDYTRPVAETRRLEAATLTPQRNGDTLLGWDAYQHGRVALIFATLYVSPARRALGEWDMEAYRDMEQARARYRAQAESYLRLTDTHPSRFRLLRTRADLHSHISAWRAADLETPNLPVGLTMLMEGAEGVRSPSELPEWWELGVRTIGPAWAGTRFCGGTREPGPLTDDGRALLAGMAEIGFTLDISHMDRIAVLQALDSYDGHIIATHANAAALLPGTESNRHLTDDVIDGLLERDGIIGIVPFNRFLKNGWLPANGRQEVPLDLVAAQIDYICQRAGDALHVGIGSDFDGGFGVQETPHGIDTIADLHQLTDLLQARGYTQQDTAAILGENWLRHLENALEGA